MPNDWDSPGEVREERELWLERSESFTETVGGLKLGSDIREAGKEFQVEGVGRCNSAGVWAGMGSFWVWLGWQLYLRRREAKTRLRR